MSHLMEVSLVAAFVYSGEVPLIGRIGLVFVHFPKGVELFAFEAAALLAVSGAA